MQNIRVLFQYFQSVHGLFASIPSIRCKEESPVSVCWKDIKAAFRVKGCVYLYVNPMRAFLLPDGQANVSDGELWSFIAEHMGEKAKPKTPI